MARLFIRTEASAQIGMGHFMRCFAVAESARKRNIEVVFLMSEDAPAVTRRTSAIGAAVQIIGAPLGTDADAVARCGIEPDDWLMVDSYKATPAYHTALHAVSKLAVVDDLNAFDAYDCDLLINAADAAFDMGYGRKTRAGLLLGAGYAMIRDEFLTPRPANAKDAVIAVMFGGSDPGGLTIVVAERLHYAFPDMSIRVVAGPANAHIGLLHETAQALSNVEVFVDPTSVADVLSGATLVVTAAGGSVGEVAAMALPAVVLVVYDNQAAALQACPFPVIDVRKGLPDDLEAVVTALLDTPGELKAIAMRGHAVVDGKGAQRIVEAMFGV